ncbi:hypothetical protein BV378_28385 [Nostoc sp. RF31YmG]|nr:hypothetical protein BV378_28385 [Nostoc sp. RF31YmG]
MREITLSYWKPITQEFPNENSIKRPRKAFRNAIEEAFPASTIAKSGYYLTKAGKNKSERYEHLALWYSTTSKERWEVVGDNARTHYFANWGKPDQQAQQLEPPQPQQPETVQPAQTTLDDMNISQMLLDTETQQMVENAIAHSGMSLADFVRKACQVYAKTVTGKYGQYESDLTAVTTEDLLSSPTYKTHPGRAEELTRRAIYALETHNNNCTEKSQKWMITQTAIQALTGSKPATIKTILEKYKTRLEDHNKKHELNPYDNRKPGRKIDDEIDLSALVPDGLDVV